MSLVWQQLAMSHSKLFFVFLSLTAAMPLIILAVGLHTTGLTTLVKYLHLATYDTGKNRPPFPIRTWYLMPMEVNDTSLLTSMGQNHLTGLHNTLL